ncbi:hypothetical protein MIS46_02055 [Wielerella bovis]|uniref:hypothetical protein n=1 Tax=Wielerella bovis TaxID=2917790 RepID=UPI0020189F37|nr:hypothetical protein [Wielerella bovis]ULJ62879.1 hypothetical protein MIS46_02055 [Wielerella bovis]
MNENDKLVLFLLGFIPKSDLSDWFDEYIANHEVDEISVDFFEWHVNGEYGFYPIRDYLKSQYADFSENSVYVETILARYLLSFIQKYMENDLSECEFCYQFAKIEAHFLNHYPKITEKNVIYYPDWLKGLYDACDWCAEKDWHADEKADFRHDLWLAQKSIETWLQTA